MERTREEGWREQERRGGGYKGGGVKRTREEGWMDRENKGGRVGVCPADMPAPFVS